MRKMKDDMLEVHYRNLRRAQEELAEAAAQVKRDQAAYREAAEDELLRIAKDNGLYDLPPEQIDAIFKKFATILADDHDEGHDEGQVSQAAGGSDLAPVVIGVGRNVGAEKRNLLRKCGLTWNGRQGRWTGACSRSNAAVLRATFGDKVKIVDPSSTSPMAPEPHNNKAEIDAALPNPATVPLRHEEPENDANASPGSAAPAENETSAVDPLKPLAGLAPLSQPDARQPEGAATAPGPHQVHRGRPGWVGPN